ncbi:hypothetical protein SK128_020439 [Halocaridina rubra]|uniref:Uncharacterized protein n=1 Tax=Halocaridina rubra TaxID=373956 RepID=A0AAN8WS57_HALRR
MSSAAFRIWKLSMDGWIFLNRWPDLEAITHIWPNFVLALQQALDSRFSKEMWMGFTLMLRTSQGVPTGIDACNQR